MAVLIQFVTNMFNNFQNYSLVNGIKLLTYLHIQLNCFIYFRLRQFRYFLYYALIINAIYIYKI